MISDTEKSYLDNLGCWDDGVARTRATTVDLTLTQQHFEILMAAREFYNRFGFAPSMRPLSKYISEKIHPDKGKSLYLLKLFPDSPARLVAEISGLPAPRNCI